MIAIGFLLVGAALALGVTALLFAACRIGGAYDGVMLLDEPQGVVFVLPPVRVRGEIVDTKV